MFLGKQTLENQRGEYAEIVEKNLNCTPIEA